MGGRGSSMSPLGLTRGKRGAAGGRVPVPPLPPAPELALRQPMCLQGISTAIALCWWVWLNSVSPDAPCCSHRGEKEHLLHFRAVGCNLAEEAARASHPTLGAGETCALLPGLGEDWGGLRECRCFPPSCPISQGTWGLPLCMSRAAAETWTFYLVFLADRSSPAVCS